MRWCMAWCYLPVGLDQDSYGMGEIKKWGVAPCGTGLVITTFGIIN
ncbi:hypothetical protein [Moraxella lacunata]